jgi:tetratricopeptide (TPR) repeat protein
VTRAVDPLGSAKVAELPPMGQVALQHYAEAQKYLENGDFKAALPLFQEVAYQVPGFSPAVKGYAHCLSKAGDTATEPTFMWARLAARSQGFYQQEVACISAQVAFLQSRGEWDRAMALAMEGLHMAKARDLDGLQGTLQNQIGTLNQTRNHLTEAEACYTRSLILLRKVEDPMGIAHTMNNLATLERLQGKVDEAKNRYLEMLKIMHDVGDQMGEGVVLSNLGDLEIALGHFPQAETYLNRAQNLRATLGDGPGLANTLVNLGGLAQARGRLGQARDFENQALNLSRVLHLQPMEALSLYNLGELDRTVGRYETAVGTYQASLALYRAMDDKDMEAHCLAAQAECAARQGRLANARSLFAASQALSADQNPYCLRTQGWLARTGGREPQAKEAFRKALDRAPKEAPEIVPELKAALGLPTS